MGGSSAPAPPDYVGAAQAQGQANLEATIASGKINNPNVTNPYGTQTVTWKGGQPSVIQQLSPDQQALFDKSNQAKSTIADTGVLASKNVQQSLSKPLSFDGLPAAPKNSGQYRDDVIKAMMSRVDTDTAGQRSTKNSELIAAGIRPGTAAYDSAMGLIDRQYNDARQNAIKAGGDAAAQDYGMDLQSRNQAIFEALQQRSVPLNEINALLSGSQVSSPFAGNLGYQPGANAQAAPIFGATQAQGQSQQNQYNQQQAMYNNNVAAGAGLIGSLGSAAMYK